MRFPLRLEIINRFSTNATSWMKNKEALLLCMINIYSIFPQKAIILCSVVDDKRNWSIRQKFSKVNKLGLSNGEYIFEIYKRRYTWKLRNYAVKQLEQIRLAWWNCNCMTNTLVSRNSRMASVSTKTVGIIYQTLKINRNLHRINIIDGNRNQLVGRRQQKNCKRLKCWPLKSFCWKHLIQM